MSPDTFRNVIDSIFPVEEEIRRFRAARNGASASELSNASSSRDALVRRFVRAVESRDSAELGRMIVNAAEFIGLYYPTSPFAVPPYKQSPELAWLLLQQNSEKGVGRVLQRYGGAPLGFDHWSCKAEPVVQHRNRLWEDCIIYWRPLAGAVRPNRLFGSILERDGRFKFLSFANDL